MGGVGSGNFWNHCSKKTVVEDCRCLEANRWMREKILIAGVHHRGSWNWYNARTLELDSAISYEVCTLEPANPWLSLGYTLSVSKQAVDYTVRLSATSPRFGGL